MRSLLFLLFLVFGAGLAAQQNLPEHFDKPYVILISLDGYRYDYTERFRPPNLTRLLERGVQAESMIPSFPSKTFPNHYTIATGCYPENHRLVNNTFYNPEKQEMYQIRNREVVEDGSWYGATPLWVLAEQNGMVAASYFFVGSEADVQQVRPSFYYRYDGSTPNRTRVQQALAWLQLPPGQRPHLITLYFSDMDDAGHRHGPNNDEKLKAALYDLDEVLGELFAGVAALDLPVNFIIVSDHGMAEVRPDKLLPLELLEDEERYRIANNGALAHIYLQDTSEREAVYARLKAREAHFRVYRTEEFPYYRTNRSSPLLGDLIVLPDFGFYLVNARRKAAAQKLAGSVFGEHGFAPEFKEMHAIFYAQGPSIKAGMTIPPFENIHVYPLVCRILGLPVPRGIDGDEAVLAPVLR